MATLRSLSFSYRGVSYNLTFHKDSTHPVHIQIDIDERIIFFNLTKKRASELVAFLEKCCVVGSHFYFESEQFSSCQARLVSKQVVQLNFGAPTLDVDLSACLGYNLCRDIKMMIVGKTSVTIIDEFASIPTVEENQRKETDDNLRSVFG